MATFSQYAVRRRRRRLFLGTTKYYCLFDSRSYFVKWGKKIYKKIQVTFLFPNVGHYHRSRATLTLVKESNSFSRFSAKSSKTSKPPIFTSVKNVDIASSSSHRISTFTSRRNSTGSSEEMEPTSVLKYSATNRHDFQLTKVRPL